MGVVRWSLAGGTAGAVWEWLGGDKEGGGMIGRDEFVGCMELGQEGRWRWSSGLPQQEDGGMDICGTGQPLIFHHVSSEGSEKEPLAVVGSPYWMAPEVLRGEIYNEKLVLPETVNSVCRVYSPGVHLEGSNWAFPIGDKVPEPQYGSAGRRRAVALQNGGYITSRLQGTSMTPHSLQADVFAYGIILCETIARVPADPDYLPRTEVTLGWEQGELWVATLGLGPLHQIRGAVLCWAETHVQD
ncbi:hypothetical protein Nmel_007867 [Mimus melanotis]